MRHAHPSPADATPNGQIAGTATTAMFASGRSRGALAIRMTLIRGNGIADSIPAVIPANVPAAGFASLALQLAPCTN